MPCSDRTCDWVESPTEKLMFKRWYSTDQILPDNRVFVVGGRNSFSYEFVPKKNTDDFHNLDFLQQTLTPGEENNLYPFVHLSSDGNLYIFTNQDSILLDYKTNKVL